MRSAIPLILVTAIGLSFHQWLDPLWHDECYTVANFATGSFVDALWDYHAPNNHQLFSLLLGQYRLILPNNWSVNPQALRFIPFCFFIASILLLYRLVTIYAGKRPAFFAALCFVTSHAVLNFALEVRGYSASWLPALIAWWGLMRIRSGKHGLTHYAGAAFIAQGILPTNLLIFATLCVWFAAEDLREHGKKILPERIGLWLILAIIPLAMTALFLVPVASQLQGSIRGGADMARSTFLWHMPWSFLRDFIWLLPILAIARLLKSPQPDESKPTERQVQFNPGLFSITSLLIPLVITLCLPKIPNDRVFVTLAPLIYIGLGVLLSQQLQGLTRQTAWYTGTVLGLLFFGGWREATGADFFTRHAGNIHVHDLYDQEFQHNYHIDETLQSINDISGSAVVVIGQCDPYGLFWHLKHRYSELYCTKDIVASLLLDKNAEMMNHTQKLVETKPLFIVALNQDEANTITAKLLPTTRPTVHLVAAHGFFNLYTVKK